MHQCFIGHLNSSSENRHIGINILRFPSFQSCLVLPQPYRDCYRKQLEAWRDYNHDNPLLHEHERNHVQRLIDYLDVVKTPHSESFDLDCLTRDFAKFYQQYDQRRGKNFTKTFINLKDWYESIQS